MGWDEADLALVLSGGNALGAYQGGAYQALHEAGLSPGWVVGASAGAINGGVICGNPSDQRIQKLKILWGIVADEPLQGASFLPEEARRTYAAVTGMTAGRSGFFRPRWMVQSYAGLVGDPSSASLYDMSPLNATLERLISYDLLNQQLPRFSAVAVDVENGQDVYFDNHAHSIGPDHLRASSALMPAYAPVDIGGRLFADAGISANLPLDVVLSEPRQRPLVCIAIDLLPLEGKRPNTLGEATSRAEDLMFATQSRRAIAAWQAIFAERRGNAALAPITLLYIAYADQEDEVSGKAFDFSSRSAELRWSAGFNDVKQAIDGLPAVFGATSTNFSVYSLRKEQFGNKRLIEVRWKLAPTLA